MEETPQDWFFTFGSAHRHPVTGASLGRHYVRLHGTCDGTRALMLALFGPRWAFQYPAERFGHIARRYELTELPVTEVKS